MSSWFSVQSDAACPLPAEQSQEILHHVQRTVADHVDAARDEVFHEADLRLQVVEWSRTEQPTKGTRHTMQVRIAVEGMVNGVPLERRVVTASRDGGYWDRQEAVYRDRFGEYWKVYVVRLMRLFWKSFSPQVDDECLRSCLADICAQIDRAAGRRTGRPFKSAHRVALVLAIVVLLGISGLPLFVSAEVPYFAFPLYGVFLGLSVYGTALMCGMAFFPSEFFEHDSFGKRVMARSGVQSVWQLRIVILLLAVACLGAVGYFTYGLLVPTLGIGK